MTPPRPGRGAEEPPGPESGPPFRPARNEGFWTGRPVGPRIGDPGERPWPFGDAPPAPRPVPAAPMPRRPGAEGSPDILMLSAAHPPDDIRVVGKEGAALAAAGWRVAHLCPEPAGGMAASHAGVALIGFPRPGGFRNGPCRWVARVLGIPALARRAAATGARAIHASEPDAWLAAILAARRSGAKVVIDVHEHYPSRLDSRLPRVLRPAARALLRALCRAAAARADAVVVAKDGLDADFRPRGGPPVVAVRNYAEAPDWPPRAHGPGPVTLLHLGALNRARGSQEMLDALALCPPATRLSLVGRFTDGGEAAFLGRAAALGLGGRVSVSGWRPRAEAMALAGAADIALVLFQPGVENHRLALPHKLFDAMLLGLPVIAPAFAEEVAAVVRDSGCGVLVDSADPAAIARAVEALGDPVVRTAMGERGRAAAMGRFGWAGEAERLVGLYERLVKINSSIPT